MAKQIPESNKQIVKRLKKLGFSEVRDSGGHRHFADAEERHLVTVAMHPGDMHPSDIRSIIRQTGLTKDEFYRRSS